jgi:hypothetical protein
MVSGPAERTRRKAIKVHRSQFREGEEFLSYLSCLNLIPWKVGWNKHVSFYILLRNGRKLVISKVFLVKPLSARRRWKG